MKKKKESDSPLVDDVMAAIRACPDSAQLMHLPYGGYVIEDGGEQIGSGVTPTDAWLDAAIPRQNVQEHATLSAGASVERGVDVGTTGEQVNRAADRGCCVSPCSESSSSGGDAGMPEARPELLGRVKRIVECGSVREVNDLLSETPGIILATLLSGNWEKRRIKIRYSVGLFTSEVQ